MVKSHKAAETAGMRKGIVIVYIIILLSPVLIRRHLISKMKVNIKFLSLGYFFSSCSTKKDHRCLPVKQGSGIRTVVRARNGPSLVRVLTAYVERGVHRTRRETLLGYLRTPRLLCGVLNSVLYNSTTLESGTYRSPSKV